MIKTALKHWIYEVCIEQLFDGIGKNFNHHSSRPNFKRHERYRSITFSENILKYDQPVDEDELIEEINQYFDVEINFSGNDGLAFDYTSVITSCRYRTHRGVFFSEETTNQEPSNRRIAYIFSHVVEFVK